MHEELSDSDFLAMLKALAANDFYQVNFSGGEPLLRRGRLFEGIRFCRDEGIGCAINTNGSLLTVDDFKRMKEDGLASLLISFPSSNESTFDRITGTHGNWSRVVRAIELSKTYDLTLAVNMVVTQANQDQVYETGYFLQKEFDLHNFGASPIYAVNTDQRDTFSLNRKEVLQLMDELLELHQKTGMAVSMLRPLPFCIVDDRQHYRDFLKSCSAGTDEIAVDPNGQVKVCTSYIQSFGNLVHEPLETILDRMSDWRKEAHEEGCVVFEGCIDCEAVSRCRGGCRVEAETYSGHIRGKNPFMVGPLRRDLFVGRAAREADLLHNRMVFKEEWELTPYEEFYTVSNGRVCFRLTKGEAGLYHLLRSSAERGENAFVFCHEQRMDRHLVNRFLNFLRESGVVDLGDSRGEKQWGLY